MIIHPESHLVAKGGRRAARAAARLMALQARGLLAIAQEILEAVEDIGAADVARAAGEATTDLILATHDGPNQAFACKR